MELNKPNNITAVDKVKSKISNLDTELLALSSMYNLHFIQAKNIYINSILTAYKDGQSEDYNLASLLNNNQVLLTNTRNKISKTMNMSLKMYGNIWKIFIKEIEKTSLLNSANEFYSKFESDEFVELSIVKTSRSSIYFKLKNATSLQVKNIQFSFKPRSREEREHLIENKNIWVHTSHKLRSSIKKHKDKISNLSGNITLPISLFSSRFVYKFASSYFSKIKDRTSGNINIEILSINEEQRTVIVKSSIFIPLSFIEHINKYIYKNTLYKVHIDKKYTERK